MEYLRANNRVIAIVTDPHPVTQAIAEVNRLVDEHSFIAADLPLLARARKHTLIREYLDSSDLDTNSSLGYQLSMRRPSHEISHFPQTCFKKEKGQRPYRDVLANPPQLGSSYKTTITSDNQYTLLEEAIEDFNNSSLGKLLTGGRNSDFSLDEEFLEKPYETIPSVYELQLKKGRVCFGEENKRFMLLHPDFL